MVDKTCVAVEFNLLSAQSFDVLNNIWDVKLNKKSTCIEKLHKKFMFWQVICTCYLISGLFMTSDTMHSPGHIKMDLRKQPYFKKIVYNFDRLQLKLSKLSLS